MRDKIFLFLLIFSIAFSFLFSSFSLGVNTLAFEPNKRVGWWLFDEGKGTIINDSSGQENQGRIFGPLWAEGLNGWITTDFYDNKLKEYKQRQEEINMELADHTKADKSFYITASLVLELAQRAYKLFMSSKLARRRQLLGILLSNSTLNGKDLKIHLKTPFNSILAYQESPDLCPLLDAFRKMNWHKVFKIPEVIIPQMQELLVSV